MTRLRKIYAKLVQSRRGKKVKHAFDVLAGSDLAAREDAWR
jgi:hypothetical protein